MNKTSTHETGAAYNLMSTVRSTDFYGSGDVNEWKSDNRWDYLSIWLYVEKPEGVSAESTKIARLWGRDTLTIPFNTWYEYRLTKEALANDMPRPFATLAGSQGINTGSSNYNGWNTALFYLGEYGYTGDYKVYVDSISYEKHSIFEVTATQDATTHEVTVTITPNGDIDFADFSNISYNVMFGGDARSKAIAGTTQTPTFTFTPNPNVDAYSGAEIGNTVIYGICVTLTYNGVTYTGYYNIYAHYAS